MPSVPRLWPGSTIVCLASGPSLTADDAAYVCGRARAIAINTTYLRAPWADVLYACDWKWWSWHQGAPTFQGLKYALQPGAERWPGVQVLRNTGREGLELDPAGLRTGRNSGYQAINLAVHLGAARILLLGYDMQRTGGREHWHPAHPDASQGQYGRFLQMFPTLVEPLAAVGVEIINCTRETALTCFPRMPLREALPESATGAAA